MSDLVLPSSNIVVVCPPGFAGLHITSARLRLGDHHFCHRQYAQQGEGRKFDLELVIAEQEFVRLTVDDQIAVVRAHSGNGPCRLVTRCAEPEMIVAINQMHGTEIWEFWPTKEKAQADLAAVLGVEWPPAPH